MTSARATRVVIAVATLTAIAAIGFILLTRTGESQLGIGQATAAAATQTASVPTLPATRLTKLPHATPISGVAPIVVRLSGVPTATSPRPWLSPRVNGTWTTVGDEEVFTPASTLLPCGSYTLTIPADSIATGHSRLGTHRIVPLPVACPSTAALQIALARLDYLPYHMHPDSGRVEHRGAETREQAATEAFDPPRGHLVAEADDAPPVSYGDGADPATVGALEIFQTEHGIPSTGVSDARTWESLLAAETDDRRNPQPYTWVTVTESLPETLEVHEGTHVVYSTLANTGVPGADTAQGVFPIYERFLSTTMTGTNVDGSKYVDPGIPWVNYFNGGDAVHGYVRGSYGFPQSNGCVELPPANAKVVYGYLQIGDIVWVQ